MQSVACSPWSCGVRLVETLLFFLFSLFVKLMHPLYPTRGFNGTETLLARPHRTVDHSLLLSPNQVQLARMRMTSPSTVGNSADDAKN